MIPRKDEAENRVGTFESTHGISSSVPVHENKLSVVILGLDATSRMNFIRAMPKSNKYLLKTMSAVSLDGYTKVAENTLPNVIPLLTGRTLDEFKKECVDESLGGSHVHLDECPFIWKVFAENGYRTSLAEDDVDIGIFNMNWGNAFVNPPTDYYLRTFSNLMQKRSSFKSGYCYGGSLSFDKLLENIKSTAEVFTKEEKYMQLIWSTKLSHDDFNKLRWGDESLFQLLQFLHTGNLLNTTAFLVLGDHGSRLDRIRGTAQGKLEDRLPVSYIVLPKWFQTKYRRAFRNLKKNANRITSAFDLYKTFYDFMNLDNLLNKKPGPIDKNSEEILLPNKKKVSLSRYRGMSLFNEAPENRTCFAAGIPLHWCVCHRKVQLDKESDLVQGAGEFVVTSLNILMKEHSSCSELLLQSVDEASKWDSSEIVREECHVENNMNGKNATEPNTSVTGGSTVRKKNDSHFTNDATCKSDSEVLVLQIAFTTTPGDATFETTLIKLTDGKWRLTENVVRTNSYEGQSECVEQKLKPYCYCVEEESFFGDLF